MFCVHCGKPTNPQVRFCPHCGKPAGNAAAAPMAAPVPQVSNAQAQQNLYSQQQFQPVAPPSPKQPKERDPKATKKILIAVGSVLGAAFLGAGIWGGIILFGSGDAQKAALAEGLTQNCDTAFLAEDVFDAETQSSNGIKTLSVFVEGRNMDWVLVEETSAEYVFEIDSIYSASAIRAQYLGCELAFTVRK